MSVIDWIVLLGCLLGIVAYGTWKTRVNKNVESYFLGDKSMGWAAIGLSVMATQASAITFISAPGLAYESGIEFVQNYFGLPLALIVVAAVFIPIYYRLKVYTAYEYLESRFDLKTRMLAAFLFLLQRGLAAGITIYAPAIILSTVLGWNLSLTILLVGILVIIYTVSGGTKAVSITQKWQMAIILFGMLAAFFTTIYKFPSHLGIQDALFVSGKLGKLNAVNFSFDFNERYTFWSGITGGFFLALSYFGTDQSQVQRYLGGKNTTESRMGLMFNALLKIPMQFFILLCGIMVFFFFQFQSHSVLFDEASIQKVYQTPQADEFKVIEKEHETNFQLKEATIKQLLATKNTEEGLRNELLLKNYYKESKDIRDRAKALVKKAVPGNTAKDSDFVFLNFVINHLPVGLVGLLLAVIISAAMSSTASELNALSSTTTMDFYKRIFKVEASESHYLKMSKLITALWGVIAITFALVAHLLENLIEAVNILGSLFYGTILGIFITAFFVKFVRSTAMFTGALFAQFMVIYIYWQYDDVIAYLWLNVIGCGGTIIFASLLAIIFEASNKIKT